MKKIISLFFALVLCSNPLFSHTFDKYNAIVLERPTSSKYSIINEKLKTCFESKGFQVYLNQNLEDVPQEAWHRTLNVGWKVDPCYGCPSTVTVIFYDYLGKEVATYIEDGFSFTLKADVKMAINKITQVIKNTPYTFRGENVMDEKDKFPPIIISEDSLVTYFAKNNISNIEGIYKIFGENWYRFAVIKQNDKYAAFILEAENPHFKHGDIKAYFEPIRSNLFGTTYIMGDKSTKEILSMYEDGMLSFAIGEGLTTIALKVYPADIISTIPADSINDDNVRATGSGFFISDKIVATNYHVVEDANKLRIVVKNDVDIKEYNARVLITDKINDLALISIVDKEFTGVNNIPYSLFPETKEVGTSVFTMGYPLSYILGDEIKITDGIISAKTGFQGEISQYQISAPIQPGSSGGALFDRNGVLVGITSGGVPSAQNVNYAIKSIYLKNLIDSAPILIELPHGVDLTNKELTDLVKVLSPYIVHIQVY